MIIFLIWPILEARAEICQKFRSLFGQWSFKKNCFWDLLTFNRSSILRGFFIHIGISEEFFRNSAAVCYLTRKDKTYQRKGYLWPLFNSIVFILGMFQLFKTEICPKIRWQRISSWILVTIPIGILFAHKSSLLRVCMYWFLVIVFINYWKKSQLFTWIVSRSNC